MTPRCMAFVTIMEITAPWLNRRAPNRDTSLLFSRLPTPMLPAITAKAIGKKDLASKISKKICCTERMKPMRPLITTPLASM